MGGHRREQGRNKEDTYPLHFTRSHLYVPHSEVTYVQPLLLAPCHCVARVVDDGPGVHDAAVARCHRPVSAPSGPVNILRGCGSGGGGVGGAAVVVVDSMAVITTGSIPLSVSYGTSTPITVPTTIPPIHFLSLLPLLSLFFLSPVRPRI